MKVHKIILPSFANGGGDIERPRNRALQAITRAFGGMTSWPAIGHWQNPDTGAVQSEAVTVHAIAFEPSDASLHLLREIAANFGRDAGQHSVYIEHADGTAEMVQPAEAPHVTGHYPPDVLNPAPAIAA